MHQEYHIQPVFDTILEHGEGPIWDSETQQFYWVDLLQGKYFRGDIEKGAFSQYSIGQPLGVLGLRENDKYVMATRDGFGLYNEATTSFELIEPSPEQHNPEVRFNDGIISPRGQFWAGTMEWEGAKQIGKLFKLNKDLSFETLETDLIIPNGMGWNASEDTFFMIDTEQHCVFAYDYDSAKDNIANRRIFIQFGKDEFPDGMTIDANDHFWIAMWSGGKLMRFDAEGKKVEDIMLPVPYPTSCCFGGKALDTLFITSSRIKLNEEEIQKYPLSGGCFMMKTASKGKPEYRFRA